MTQQIERALQKEVMMRLKCAPIDALVIPVPNGIWIPARTVTEMSLVARLIARMKADGYLMPGVADLLVLGKSFAGAIELKRPATNTVLGRLAKGRLSEDQIGFKDACEMLGIPYVIATCWAEVEGALKRWGLWR